MEVDEQMKLNSPSVEERVDIYWSLVKQFYPCLTDTISDAGKHIIHYDNDDHRVVDISNKTWRLETSVLLAPHRDVHNVQSDEDLILYSMFDMSGKSLSSLWPTISCLLLIMHTL